MKERYMENQKQKVSVIVPIYNVVQYLPQCIESLCMQTYENIEIIKDHQRTTQPPPKKTQHKPQTQQTHNHKQIQLPQKI